MTVRKDQSFYAFIRRIANPYYVINTLLFSHLNQHAVNSYSQEGEDRVIFSILAGKTSGYYVDVGAHHPQRFSNTNLFYNLGWNGINIDANKDAIELFRRTRSRDINLYCGVGTKSGKQKFTIFNEGAINTFEHSKVKEMISQTQFKVKETRMVQIKKLSHILDKYLPKNQHIDFLTIDVEGRDFDVLKSNNWHKYRPSIIAIEIFGGVDLLAVANDKTTIYLSKFGYLPIAKTLNTVIYKHES